MKILAVIPARAGSSGIPNKNIRLLNGKPMIYYAIKNAIDSEYITDVIVSSDSMEIKVIAERMGVTFHERDAALCDAKTTLDAVIFDVVKDIPCDVVVTMQPTSPTLKVETLDRAIEYAIRNDVDTVIAVRNAPHLSWRNENGVNLPNYEKRVNRQYLPAHYEETGAFVISKRSVVTETTRIGEKVDVFEVSENEAIDVDTFKDLTLASAILETKKIAFYVNGNNKRGTGHIYRTLELADEFFAKPDIYYDINQTDCSIFGTTTHNLIPVNGIVELFERIRNGQYDLVINDILSTSLDYMIGLRSVMPPSGKIVNFEDEGEGASAADLVFNALYEAHNRGNVYAGEDYYIAPKLFLYYDSIDVKETVECVFISFGGADPQNYTDRIMNIITKEKYAGIRFIVAIGRAKKNVDELLEYNKYTNLEVYYDVENMPELMKRCDVSISSRGRTPYELAILGIPAIVLAQNEREENHGFASDEHGFFYMGADPSDHMLEAALDMYIGLPKSDRERLQEKLLSNNLKSGRQNVIKLINNL